MNYFRSYILVFLSFGVIDSTAAQESVRLNQEGFYPGGPKLAVTTDVAANAFFVVESATGDTVFSSSAAAPKTWPPSGELVRVLDFSSVTQVGEFQLQLSTGAGSHGFRIDPYVHQKSAIASLKAFYYQRASTALPVSFAGVWTRAAGHPDDDVRVHASAATAARPENTVLRAPKGWYDAGDFNKYVVNAGISVYSLLALYEHFPEYYGRVETNIPESGNGVPDVLDEVMWSLRWLLAMQDPNDGGIYHKLTSANFSGDIMPNRDRATRYVVQKSTPAALNFAAVMAQAGRIFRSVAAETPGFADTCLAAALDAWRWARVNPAMPYRQSDLNRDYNPDINTGEYGDAAFADEWQWAAAELFISTTADSFLAVSDPTFGSFDVPWWARVKTLGLFSLAHHRMSIAGEIDTALVRTKIINLANGLRGAAEQSAYRVAIGRNASDFVWGSNSVAANQGIVLVQAHRLTGDRSYLDAAIQNLDYLLGRNATGFAFLTGAGTKSPRDPHHRQSRADGVPPPVPGLLAGGPNPGREDGCTGYLGPSPAESYVDSWCSYASNEIAINWNAAFAYLSGAIEALSSPDGLPLPTSVRQYGSANPEEDGLRFDVHPNPFNESTRFRWRLESPGSVTVELFDITGRRVQRRDLGRVSAGPGQLIWDGQMEDGSAAGSGVYIARLRVDGDAGVRTKSRRLVLLK